MKSLWICPLNSVRVIIPAKYRISLIIILSEDLEPFLILSGTTLLPSPYPRHSLCWYLNRLRMQVIFLLCHCPTALSYIYFIVLLWWLLRAFVSFCASVKNIYGFYSMLRGRPLVIIEEIQRCHIKAAFCIPTGICRYYQAGGVCLSAVHVWSEEGHRKTRELVCPCCGRAGAWAGSVSFCLQLWEDVARF